MYVIEAAELLDQIMLKNHNSKGGVTFRGTASITFYDDFSHIIFYSWIFSSNCLGIPCNDTSRPRSWLPLH